MIKTINYYHKTEESCELVNGVSLTSSSREWVKRRKTLTEDRFCCDSTKTAKVSRLKRTSKCPLDHKNYSQMFLAVYFSVGAWIWSLAPSTVAVENPSIVSPCNVTSSLNLHVIPHSGSVTQADTLHYCSNPSFKAFSPENVHFKAPKYQTELSVKRLAS